MIGRTGEGMLAKFENEIGVKSVLTIGPTTLCFLAFLDLMLYDESGT